MNSYQSAVSSPGQFIRCTKHGKGKTWFVRETQQTGLDGCIGNRIYGMFRPFSRWPARARSRTERELFNDASGVKARKNAKTRIHKCLVFNANFEVPWEGWGDFLGELTWASARGTRYNPGCNMAGFQP